MSNPKPYPGSTEPEVVGQWLADIARAGAELGPCGKMCKDCAFKYPQPITQDYIEAAEFAQQMLAWEGNFHCHTEDHKDAGYGCAGFEYARRYLNHALGVNTIDSQPT